MTDSVHRTDRKTEKNVQMKFRFARIWCRGFKRWKYLQNLSKICICRLKCISCFNLLTCVIIHEVWLILSIRVLNMHVMNMNMDESSVL